MNKEQLNFINSQKLIAIVKVPYKCADCGSYIWEYREYTADSGKVVMHIYCHNCKDKIQALGMRHFPEEIIKKANYSKEEKKSMIEKRREDIRPKYHKPEKSAAEKEKEHLNYIASLILA